MMWSGINGTMTDGQSTDVVVPSFNQFVALSIWISMVHWLEITCWRRCFKIYVWNWIVTTEFLMVVTTKFLSSGMWHCAVWLSKSNILFTKFCSCQNTMTSAFGDTSLAGRCGSACWKFYLMPWSFTSHHIQSISLPYTYSEILTSFYPQMFSFHSPQQFFSPSSGPPSPTDSFEFLLPALTSLYLYHLFPVQLPRMPWSTSSWFQQNMVLNTNCMRSPSYSSIYVRNLIFEHVKLYFGTGFYSGHDWKEVGEHCRSSSCRILYTIHENCYSLYFRFFEVGDWLNSLTALWCMKLTQELWFPAFRGVMSCGLVITSRLQCHIPEETTNFIVTTVRNSNLTWYKSWSNNCVL